MTSDGLLGERVGTVTRCSWVAARKAEGFPTKAACSVAEVSRQTFYDWLAHGEAELSRKQRSDVDLVEKIRAVHADSRGAYGSRRVTAQLRRDGHHVNHKRVERLMRINGICGIHKKRKPRYKPLHGTNSPPEDLVRRDFSVGAINQTWSGDITSRPHK